MKSLKEMLHNKVVRFVHYNNGELVYTTECGFEFPVPIDDVGTAYMLNEDKAMLFMRWVRIAVLEHYKTQELKENAVNGQIKAERDS